MKKVILGTTISFFLLIASFTNTSAAIPLPDSTGCPLGELGTGIGCVPVDDMNEFSAFLLEWSLGIAGAIALLLIGYSGIQMSLASGNPQKVQAAKELFTAATTGLLFMIFSAFILRFVGIDVLKIPGL